MGSRLAALIVAVVLTAIPVPAQDVDRSPRKRSPKREVEALMSEGLPFAEKMLGEHGEFFPFGAVMLPSGLVRMVGAFDEREQPAPEEVLAFLSDTDPEKRSKWIDRLLESEAFTDYWAMKWGDLLRIKAEFPSNLWPNAVQAYHRWVRAAIRRNM